MGFLRSTLHRFIPSHFHDPVGLALRLLKTGDPAARFAMGAALAGIALTPVDLALAVGERRRVRRAVAPKQPIVLVCGPPRSGTTLVSQVLIAHLPVAYFNNLTSIFPRSPITANAIFGGLARRRKADYHSYYGRSRGFSGSNDALYLWDQWLGRDRATIPTSIDPAKRESMIRFFGALEQFTGKPLVAKNNNLNAVAHLVADALDTASFLCLERHPVYLAQSLLRARREIHGNEDVPYGFAGAPGKAASSVEDVCRQVLFHEELMRRQYHRIGPDRFRIVSYERFCENPGDTVRMVAGELLRTSGNWGPVGSLEAANRVRIPPEEFTAIESTLARLKAEAATVTES